MRNWTMIWMLMAGCASAPPVGVRADFGTKTVSAIAVAPTFTIDTFGVNPSERRAIEHAVDFEVGAWLAGAGFQTKSPAQFESELRVKDEWVTVEDAWYRGIPLASLFEPGAAEFEGIEVSVSQRIAGEHNILLTQVLYQSDGICRQDPSQFTAYAAADYTPDAPCVTTHLEAKLIDAPSGRIVWHNRAFVQTSQQPSPALRRANIKDAVNWLLGSSAGLLNLRPKQSAP